MRSERFIPVLLVMPFTALADDMTPESQFVPPPYKVLRFDEDYSRLSNPWWPHVRRQTSLCDLTEAR